MSPRDLLEESHRSLFGRSGAASWKRAATPEERVHRRAAEMQHEAALALWRLLRARGENIGELAARWHVNAEGVRRKMRGESWAKLHDLAMWDLEAEGE